MAPFLANEREILDQVVARLTALGFAVTQQNDVRMGTAQGMDQGIDAVLELRRDNWACRYAVQVGRNIRLGAIDYLRYGAEQIGLPGLLLAETVPEPVAEALQQKGLAWADIAGNIHLEAPGMFVHIEGRKLTRKTAAARPLKLFQPAGLRLLFMLLCAPERVDWPTRRLAEAVGIANGTVGYVLRDLEQLGYLHRRPRRLRLDRNLLDRWVDGYQAYLRPKLIAGTYQGPTNTWWQDLPELRRGDCLVGGEQAADALTHYLKPTTTTFYLRPLDEKYRHFDRTTLNAMVVRGELVQHEEGNVEFLVRFWPDDLPTEQPGLVPALLVYADLVINGDPRCLETAEMIHEQYLAERFGTH